MGIYKESFGKTKAGKDAFLYILENKNGMRVKVSDFGAVIAAILVPDQKGSYADVVHGYDEVGGYEENTPFFGAVIGRNANRVAGAEFEIDGITYHLDPNENGNNLHSHFENGFHKKLWDTEILEEKNAVKFSLFSPDGENGFPGNCKVSITYVLNEENGLELHYEGTSDKATVLNLTNHSYFNLGGFASGSVLEEKLWLNAKYYTPVVSGAIPTGEIAPVEGTPMDFTAEKRIGDEIDDDFEQLKLVGGYDHNWVLDKKEKELIKAAVVTDEAAGRKMEVYTDLPGIQFYAGNCINDKKGKGGYVCKNRSALCLETQYFPNSVNEKNFASPVIQAGELYKTTTIYKFC